MFADHIGDRALEKVGGYSFSAIGASEFTQVHDFCLVHAKKNALSPEVGSANAVGVCTSMS